ncbi:diguanylate cyclase (GGDEF) domain-containing protein [Methylophaga sulfidovorans]|uniref:Diguanylate cyclase (GGDEF) domain-containing protein n=1 Tax=Methylophaga sulfidovorans TaxID=45496 RepID=A0A1I4BI02_9GAMM|nr:GGDEF domain-containing protein [Methylophaga sulfidovorans]SFK68424.1 diguanylate cyclase (GGDEF) domain-containing protein [Methylophaga sulfidovorans]
MILSGAQAEHAAKFTKTLLDAIRNIRVELRNETLSVSASAGIRAVSSDELSQTNFDLALKHADLMLYAAKKTGRDQLMVYKECCNLA